jgi:hypothetical protein
MTVTFYNVSDDPRVVEKTLGNPIMPSVTANPLSSCSVMNPVLILTYNPLFLSANYFSIAWNNNLTLYYFMNNPVLSPGGRCNISGREDVLMSNKDDILNLVAYCSRCESKFERFAVDPKVPSLLLNNVESFPFGDPSSYIFDQSVSYEDGVHNYLLTVKGGDLS